MNPLPPHCAHFCASHAAGADVSGAGTALVTNVVGADVGDGSGAGVSPPPLLVPSHTAGPGIGYVVAFLAASESMLKAMPGSVALYAPGKETK